MALTLTQKQALKADIIAAADAACVALEASPGDPDLAAAVAALYNQAASPAWTLWRKQVTLSEIGKKLNGTELAGLTTANHTRLQTVITLISASGGLDASVADMRQFFDDIFSGAGGATTRAALLALWKKLGTRAEKLFSTGTGSDAVPATTAANIGNNFLLSTNDVLEAMTS